MIPGTWPPESTGKPILNSYTISVERARTGHFRLRHVWRQDSAEMVSMERIQEELH